MRVLTLLFIAANLLCAQICFAAKTIQLEVQNRLLEGKPLFWSKQRVTLLGRDGQLWEFQPWQAKNPQEGTTFRPFSQSEMRGALLREFNQGYEVSGTGQFLVVHPAGQRDVWAQRFEELYRSMTHYFRVRGFQMNRPQFPFVAVVFPRQHDFIMYAQEHRMRVNSNILGYYDPQSNRIFLYDVTAGQKDKSKWYVNAETIIHEAAHQTGFNTGLHSRYYQCPSWIIEGIGTMFEAPGVFDSRQYTQLDDRINRGQLEVFRQRVASHSYQTITDLLASDRMFGTNTTNAYATAWAMSFYLSEREPKNYARYLKKAASRPPFREYSPEQRVKDFTSVFGANLKMFDARLGRYIEDLKLK